MNVYKKTGANLFQYAIILSLIGITAVAVFMPLGEQIKSFYEKYLVAYTSNAETIKNNVKQQTVATSTITKGELGGTNENPKKLCTGSVCAIDYGSYVLNGIPSDFASYIENNGVSGGTDKLSDLMTQIAQQLESEGNTSQAEIVKKLSVLGHNIAQIQNQQESIINACQGDATCAEDALNSSHIDLSKLDLSYFTDGNYNKYSSENLLLDQSVGSARNSKINDPNTYQNRINDGDMLFQFVDNYDNLVNDPSISASQKSIIKELY